MREWVRQQKNEIRGERNPFFWTKYNVYHTWKWPKRPRQGTSRMDSWQMHLATLESVVKKGHFSFHSEAAKVQPPTSTPLQNRFLATQTRQRGRGF